MTAAEEIAALEAVLHQWRTGNLPEEVEYSGQRVRRAKFDPQLVQSRLDTLRGTLAGAPPVRGAIGFIF